MKERREALTQLPSLLRVIIDDDLVLFVVGWGEMGIYLLAQPPLIASLTFPEGSQRRKISKSRRLRGKKRSRRRPSQGESTECTAGGVAAQTPPAVAALTRQKQRQKKKGEKIGRRLLTDSLQTAAEIAGDVGEKRRGWR